MLEMNDVYSDFQLIGSRVKKCDFEYPGLSFDESNYDFKFDYEKIETEESIQEEEMKCYFGVLLFKVCVYKKKKKFLEAFIEGAFMGNAEACNFETFNQMLITNGLSILLQIAREQLIKISSFSNVSEAVIIPMVDINKLVKEKKEQVKNNT